MEAAVVVRGVTHLFDDLGFGTSHDAEWLALVRAVEVAHSLGLPEVELLGDALEIIRLARTALKVRSAQGRHSMVFLAAAANATATRLSVRWVKREQNLAGIALAARHLH
jgi:ribonuclease HI